MIKQALGWTRPKLRTPTGHGPVDVADRRAHAQLRLARPLAETSATLGNDQPTRTGSPRPASASDSETSARPCPARPEYRNRPARPRPRPRPRPPLGSKDKRPAARYVVGKIARRPGSIIERDPVRS